MPSDEIDFQYWVDKEGFVPTARLSPWPKNWYSTCHLRFFGSVSWVAAVPHDVRTRVRLEALHESIVKQSFFDPLVFENSVASESLGKTVYVSLIPPSVVDWFSKHTLEEIHDQIALYMALYELSERYGNPNVMGDTHSTYHAAIKLHIANICKKYPVLEKNCLPVGPHDLFEKEAGPNGDQKEILRKKWEIDAEWRENSPAEAAVYDEMRGKFDEAENALWEEIYKKGLLPPWFLRRLEWEFAKGKLDSSVELQRLRHDTDVGWRRPTGALADDFGIVSYGLTGDDELRLRGQKMEYDKRSGEVILKSLRGAESEKAKKDDLSGWGSNHDAFEFLMYAKSKKKEWSNWSIVLIKHTGYIYLYSDGRAIKIGFSAENPQNEKRKASLQTGNSQPLELIGFVEGTREKERILHNRFTGKKTIGEWFDLNEDDIKAILSGAWDKHFEKVSSWAEKGLLL